MDILVELNKYTAGRDKITRLIQYMSRFLWFQLQDKQFGNIDLAGTFKNLDYQLSTFRKVLRWGRCVDLVYTTLPQLTRPLTTCRILNILTRLSRGLYFLSDHILWLGRVELKNLNMYKWEAITNRYWVTTIGINLIKDVYEINCLLNTIRQKGLNIADVFNPSPVTYMDDPWENRDTTHLFKKYRTLSIDFFKNLCDFFIPLSRLGHIKFTAGTVGILGMISSALGIYLVMESTIK